MIPPFFSNTSDDTHCYQAALKSILKYFRPNDNYTFKKLDNMTNKIEGKWTWPQAGLLSLHNLGFEIVIHDDFNYRKFIKDEVRYLIEEYGQEVAEAQNRNSDIRDAINQSRKLLASDIEIKPKPTIEDLRSLLEQGYLLICNVNSNKLNDKKGYVGHFVVVYKIEDSQIHFHDPGLPAYKSRVESIAKFKKAWELSQDAYAFRLNN